ncbi:lysylphosphatidylglycerol synthase transmembrane domain-containing protein, partial [[Eubacterium] cellulosolvens]
MKSLWAFLVQVIIGLTILAGVGWYIGAQNIEKVLAQMDLSFILLSFLAYIGMNLIFAVRLKRVLEVLGYKINYLKTLLIQYGGMLASDITPARSGYFAVPVMLASEKVPIPIGLSSILGIQSIEFFIKMFGGCLALFYLLYTVSLSRDIFVLSFFGVVLMFAGGVVLATAMWSKRAAGLIEFLNRLPLIGRISHFLFGKVAEFQEESQKIKSIAAEILILTIVSWFVKALEWYFIALALGIDQIPFI